LNLSRGKEKWPIWHGHGPPSLMDVGDVADGMATTALLSDAFIYVYTI